MRILTFKHIDNNPES